MEDDHFHADNLGDHLHSVAWGVSGQLEPITDTDDFYDSIDRNAFGVESDEDTVSWSDMSSALAFVLEWICSSPDITHVGGRACALLAFLAPVTAPHGRTDLAKIAKECGVTRAAVSKWLINFRDEAGVSFGFKSSLSREIYRNAQCAALERGSHASQVRLRAKADANAR